MSLKIYQIYVTKHNILKLYYVIMVTLSKFYDTLSMALELGTLLNMLPLK